MKTIVLLSETAYQTIARNNFDLLLSYKSRAATERELSLAAPGNTSKSRSQRYLWPPSSRCTSTTQGGYLLNLPKWEEVATRESGCAERACVQKKQTSQASPATQRQSLSSSNHNRFCILSSKAQYDSILILPPSTPSLAGCDPVSHRSDTLLESE
jgi:hypothetical protein